jgi:NAD(P)-dependent dehydrogenase (short-subunit alcohol dehydrogenase family)
LKETQNGPARGKGRADHRDGRPDDVAKVAAFLASDDAWYVNAAGIPVDGGQSVIV